MDLPPEEVPELRELADVTISELQMALLRDGAVEHGEGDHCANCQRSLLVGEHVFICDSGRIVCELCVGMEPHMPREARLVHGPEFGQTIRIVDQRRQSR